MLKYQRTLHSPIKFSGIGLHTGYSSNMTLVPAPPGTGLIFRRTDLHGFEIEARRTHVTKVSYATTLMKKGVMISTVEHILAAIYGLEIDNLYIDIDAMEAPILDGSSGLFVEAVMRVGIEDQHVPRRFLVIEKPVEVRYDDKFAGVYPSDAPRATCFIDFEHPAIGRQRIDLELTPDSFCREIATARTFGFLADIEYLKKLGLIQGGSLENAVVIGQEEVLNQKLRFPDEFVRHKLLDLLGDIALAGFPILGHLRAERAGHAIHTALAEKILRSRDCFSILKLAPDIS